MTPVRLEPTALRSRVKHSTTEPLRSLLNGFNIGFNAYAIVGHRLADQLIPQLLMEQVDALSIQCRQIEHMHEGVWFRKIIFDKMTAVRT